MAFYFRSKKIGEPRFKRARLTEEEKLHRAKCDTATYLEICRNDNLHPVMRAVKKTLHFFKWAAGLIVPDFLIGHPNLWDNLKTLFQHPGFKPLRMALVAWIIFTLTVGTTGIYALFNTAQTQAASEYSMKTGYYVGNGVALSVTGLGFRPELIIIKSDTAVGQMVWKSSAMPSNVVTYLGTATADNNETEITLDADGFSVSAAVEVNTVSIRYTYIAFAGSDCSSVGTFCVGSYTGTTTSPRSVTTGFQPNLVWVKRTTAIAGNYRTSSMNDNHAGFFAATANDTAGSYFQTLDSTGFTVGALNNSVGGLFYYVAFKSAAGRLAVGQFTGDGLDDRSITGLGFEPDFVFVKQNSANAGVYSVTETWGDYSHLTTASANAVNNIQDLTADGFVVGTSVNVNAAAVVSSYFAFGNGAATTPAGTFFMQRGSYVGTGAALDVETSFRPDLVIIKGDTAQYAVWTTSMDNNLTHYFAAAVVGFSGGVTAMGSSGFTLGTSAVVNTNGATYEYMAFGNATTPQRGAGAADFIIGTHTGNGLNGRIVDNLPVDPDMIALKRITSVAAASVWKSTSPSMADNTNAAFAATADTTDGTVLQTLNSDGFTMGTGAAANTAGGTYTWFGFKSGSSFAVGSYSGDGVNDKNITGLGFDPAMVWIKRSTAVQAILRTTSATITGQNSLRFMNVANATNHITGFISDGFTLGTSPEVNASTGTYRYAAWKSSNSSYVPNTPTNTTPTNNATAQDLNTALTASAYADTDVNAHTDTQWQVDDDADFATPVWTRTAGTSEITTTINTASGTFANELSGETELAHNTSYYWRVRYSDGAWSSWSASTTFATNAIVTPTNSLPANASTITTLTPTLSVTAFSDPQSGHTASSTQWQIDTSDDFNTPVYDSGAIASSASFAVPSATLANQTVYYWRMRYQDSSGEWSEYSTPTRFLVSESIVSVQPIFGGTVVDQGDVVGIDAKVKLMSGTTINDAVATIDIYNPAGTKIVTAGAMSYLSDSTGIYRYAYTIPMVNGSYLYEVTATTGSVSGTGAANFEVRTIQTDLTNVSSTIAANEATAAAERASQAAERVAQAVERASQTLERASSTNERTLQEAERVAQATSRSLVSTIDTRVQNVQSNIDVLLGAMVVTQSTVNDAAATTSSFITALTNPTSDFYKNAVLTFTNGDLNGQVRRISAYNGTTKAITLDPALTSAPANGDAFTIIKQNLRIEEQAATYEATQAGFRSSVTTQLATIEGKIDSLIATLDAVDTNLDSVQTSINTLRTTQLKNYTTTLSDVSEVQAGGTYRARLTVEDAESNPVDADTTPTVIIYDAVRDVAQSTTNMTRLSTGVYEYTYSIPASVTAGLWETIANVDMDGTADIIRNDYWQVTGAPAQVIINSISDLTVPTIGANVTITNEGGGAYEYQYEWCVVSAQDNQCGGSDDVYYGSAAKLIQPGVDFTTTLTATVPSTGNYYFKLVAYFGTEASGAARSFTAIASDATPTPDPTPSSSGGGSLITPAPTQSTPGDSYAELAKARQELSVNAQKLTQTLAALEMVTPSLQRLLDVSDQNTGNLKDIQNKVSDLRAISSATRRIVEQRTVEPVVETYMKFNSVEINFIISNPTDTQQTNKFKAYLPQEARPEHVMDATGLKIDYDTNAKMYFVTADIVLAPRESVTRKVEMKDIWVFTPEEIAALRSQATSLLPTLVGTQYEAQGSILTADIESTLSSVLRRQEESYSSPQDHIIVYRENKDRIARAENNLEKLKDMVVQAGASRSVVGQVGGIQTFATWGIILAIVFGFGLLAAVIFAMWRHQTMLAAMAMGLGKKEVAHYFGQKKVLLKPTKKLTPPTPPSSIIIPWKKTLVIVTLAIVGAGAAIGLAWKWMATKQPTPVTIKLTDTDQPVPLEATSTAPVPEQIPELKEVVPAIPTLKILPTPTGWLNVRATPRLDGALLTKINPGESYAYTDLQDGWYKITLSDAREGWIFGTYVEINKP